MSEIQIPQEILNKIVNVGGVKRELYCYRCEKYKEHVQVSYAQTTGASIGAKVMGRILDLIPGIPTIMGNAFACKSCGHVRSEGGLASDVISKRSKNWEYW